MRESPSREQSITAAKAVGGIRPPESSRSQAPAVDPYGELSIMADDGLGAAERERQYWKPLQPTDARGLAMPH